MEIKNKATKIELFSFKQPHMRAFHLTWLSFFLAFFGWFGIAPLMSIVRDDLGLTKQQIGNTIIASVGITVFVRLAIGWILDRIGPRITYTWLLIIGSIPVMTIGLADSYESFLIYRLMIGAIGASFVITQYHTSMMFAPNVVGTANATTAGWGNLGGGVTQMVMPVILAAVLSFGVEAQMGWRIAMIFPGVVLFLAGIVYYFFTQDLPDGNFDELREKGELPDRASTKGAFRSALKDYRVWALFVAYAACFGVELTINNIAALYYIDNFKLSIGTAGLIAGLFGLMNLFARTLGGVFGDKMGIKYGLKGRVAFLGMVLLVEGFALMLFSRMTVLPLAIVTMIVFSLFVQMAEGATYSVVPFVNKRALGAVAGIVGAGGNVGAVSAGFLFRDPDLTYQDALFYLGIAVAVSSVSALVIRFSEQDEKSASAETATAIQSRNSKLASA